MTKTGHGSDNHDGRLASLVGQLADAAAGVAPDDLSVLAKMHGWCEAVAEITRPDGPQPAPDVYEQIQAVADLLEQLVLGEVDDSEDALASVRQMAASCVRQAPSSTDQGPAGSAPGPSAVEDLDPAVQMSKVFDEDDPESLSGSPDLPDCRQGASPQAPSEAQLHSPGRAAPMPLHPADAPPGAAGLAEPPYVQEPLVINASEIEFVRGFVEEAREHIESIESAVLEVERAPADSDKINDLFRPFHTIKGMAGFLNLRDVNRLTHEVETLLDQGRRGERQIRPGLIDLVFDVVDVLKSQVNAIAGHLAEPRGDTVPQPPVADLIGHLRAVVAGRIDLRGRVPQAGTAAQRVGENLVDQGAVARATVDFALETQQAGLTKKKTGEILVQQRAVTPRQVSQAIRAQTQVPQAAEGKAVVGEQSIRIDTAKLDQLVDMVGELVIAQTLVSTSRHVAAEPMLSKNVGQVGKIVRDVQEAAMGMRMVPIGPTFQRMARLVRDVSKKAGKIVELHIAGEDTELDKNVIQQIGDPLVHMVRNAVDHGIEPPEVRCQAGKDQTGHVYLSAFHHAGNIVIEIRDDGKGLDREVLLAKAIEKGLVRPGQELNDQQVFQLVFAPGFSTAEKVTDISGRGVGMDVVKRNIEQLRGRVEIASTLGQGSTFAIRLPLTLAIIDGMVVRVGSERFVMPTISIEQSLRPLAQQITTVQHKGEVLQVRGELVPVIQLGQLFGLTGWIDPCEAMVVIAQCDDRKIGIVVEELIGQQQVVIKALGERFGKLRGVSGAAILGDGRVGLILEMLGLEALHHTCRAASARTAVTDTPVAPVAPAMTSTAPETSGEQAPAEPELVHHSVETQNASSNKAGKCLELAGRA